MPYNIASTTCPTGYNTTAASTSNPGLRKGEITKAYALNLTDPNQLFLVR